MDISEEQCALDSCVAGMVERMHDALPDRPKARDLFGQWRDALGLALKYPHDEHAVDYANATLIELVTEMKTP